ncbi:MAG: hypothetical protein OQK47_07295, partial [Gammaproteobacteria bacterium]|nr:hypothetical protein [Gammaproteobacteria bacterium]
MGFQIERASSLGDAIAEGISLNVINDNSLQALNQLNAIIKKNEALEYEIEQRHQAETALRQANTMLSKLNADKDKLFAIISHDLRTPFNSLLGNTQLLAKMIDRWSQ